VTGTGRHARDERVIQVYPDRRQRRLIEVPSSSAGSLDIDTKRPRNVRIVQEAEQQVIGSDAPIAA